MVVAGAEAEGRALPRFSRSSAGGSPSTFRPRRRMGGPLPDAGVEAESGLGAESGIATEAGVEAESSVRADSGIATEADRGAKLKVFSSHDSSVIPESGALVVAAVVAVTGAGAAEGVAGLGAAFGMRVEGPG